MADEVLYVNFYIAVNGKELDEERRTCITKISVNEACTGSDTLTLDIEDPNYKFISDNIFVEDVRIYADLKDGSTPFSGYISAIDIDFPEEGHPRLSIFCLDESHVMNRKKKKRSWDNTTRPEVVKKIAKEYGFKCVVESNYKFKTEESISQSEVTDLAFIESLAAEETYPFMAKLIDKTIYYVKMGHLADPILTLMYRETPYDIRSFKPQINKETKQVEVEKSNIEAKTKATDRGKATADMYRDTPKKGTPTPSILFDPKTGTWTGGK